MSVQLEIPADVMWPLKVKVERDGDPVPFHLMWLWYWQFFVRAQVSDSPPS